eukprot:GEMP01018558.1.p1 GENE.GEMP01018558.1~~GEMP01018558.1.p1  ORF type:complete len:536 (+),score=76.65 GEMP01018558.1:2-1609(+)
METWRKWSIFLSIVGRVCLSLTFLGTIVCNVIAGIMMHKRLMVQISPNRVFSEIPFSCYGILLGFVTAYRAQAAILRLYDAKRLVVTIRLYVLELWNASQSRFLNEEFDLQEDDTIENIKKVFTNLHNEFMPFVMYMFRQLQISSENSGVEIRDWWDTRIREAMNKGVPIRDLPESFYHAGQACTGCEKMHLIYASLSYKIRRYLPDELPKLRKILKTYQEGLVLCCSLKMEGTRFMGIFSEVCACALCWILPFVIIGSFGYVLTPVLSVFMTISFKTLTAFAQEAESPFGSGRFDVDLFEEVLGVRQELEDSAERIRRVIKLNCIETLGYVVPSRMTAHKQSAPGAMINGGRPVTSDQNDDNIQKIVENDDEFDAEESTTTSTRARRYSSSQMRRLFSPVLSQSNLVPFQRNQSMMNIGAWQEPTPAAQGEEFDLPPPEIGPNFAHRSDHQVELPITVSTNFQPDINQELYAHKSCKPSFLEMSHNNVQNDMNDSTGYLPSTVCSDGGSGEKLQSETTQSIIDCGGVSFSGIPK